ncbi:hypothetical protein E3E22_08300 [Thermococcus sp. MV5]|uniref:hypothetical protein n=1 Tax=Thermococcus sp. MV5 TaxID=1638272 RepID=UPI00143A50EA|nr:hypothetical protein [Thermococcus sp. MV5]NJE26615.1 hypothetical protein [Thermococcus sp. MV5]
MDTLLMPRKMPSIRPHEDIVYPILVLDTNVLLDYIEKRDEKIVHFINKDLKPLAKKNKLTLGTTIYNVAELLDKEFEINLQLNLIRKRLSADKILNISKNKQRTISYITRSNDSHSWVLSKVQKRIWRILSMLEIFYVAEISERDYTILEKLVLEGILSSQDAMIILTTIKLGENYVYFLTGDQGIIKSPVANDYLEIFDSKNEQHRESLLNRLRFDIEELLG